MGQTNAGIAGALGLNVPRLTLVPSHRTQGLSASGAGFRVVHTMSGKELGIVARKAEVFVFADVPGTWYYLCPKGCPASEPMHPTADAASTALSAHVLDHELSAIRNRLALAARVTMSVWSPLPHDGPIVNGYLTREINASEHQDMVDGGRCRTSFACATPESAPVHQRCRGYYIPRDWSRQPCLCPCHTTPPAST